MWTTSMILTRQDLIGNRTCHKQKVISTLLMGSQQDQEISFKIECHKLT
jgi:hypothetical protein